MTPVYYNTATCAEIRKSYKRMVKDRAFNTGDVRTCTKCHIKFPMFEMIRRERRFPSKTHIQWYCEKCNKLVNPGWLVRGEWGGV